MSPASSKCIVLSICALAVLVLMTSLPVAAVTRATAGANYCLPPATAVTWLRPSGTGSVSSDGRGLFGTKTFWVNFLPYNPYCGASSWMSEQQIQINWTFYRWNGTNQSWDYYLSPDNGGAGNAQSWVSAYGPNYYYKVPQQYFIGVSRNSIYALKVRIAWVYNNVPMAAAYYWFDQYGDLACESSSCALLAPTTGVVPPSGAPHNSIQALYLY